MTNCTYGKNEFSPGATTCQAGTRHVCQSNGHWRDTGVKCEHDTPVSMGKNIELKTPKGKKRQAIKKITKRK